MVISQIFIQAGEDLNHDISVENGDVIRVFIITENGRFEITSPSDGSILQNVSLFTKTDPSFHAQIEISAKGYLLVNNMLRHEKNPPLAAKKARMIFDRNSSFAVGSDTLILNNILIELMPEKTWVPLATNRNGNHGDPLISKRRNVKFAFREIAD